MRWRKGRAYFHQVNLQSLQTDLGWFGSMQQPPSRSSPLTDFSRSSSPGSPYIIGITLPD
jgi:hypothetical protein